MVKVEGVYIIQQLGMWLWQQWSCVGHVYFCRTWKYADSVSVKQSRLNATKEKRYFRLIPSRMNQTTIIMCSCFMRSSLNVAWYWQCVFVIDCVVLSTRKSHLSQASWRSLAVHEVRHTLRRLVIHQSTPPLGALICLPVASHCTPRAVWPHVSASTRTRQTIMCVDLIRIRVYLIRLN